MKRIFRVFVILLVIVLTMAAVCFVLFIKLNSSPEGMPDEYMFRVEKGDTAHHIADNLYQDGLISSDSFFILYSRLMGTSGVIKSGMYKIKKDMSAIEIHDKLIEGSEELYSVTIPPGLSSGSIADILEEHEIVGKDEFLNAVESEGAEGYLFPDTYQFPKGYPAVRIIDYMREIFFANLDEIYPDYPEMKDEEILQKVILASIVEREYRNADEAPTIASVFYNRLTQNMYLGSCATVVYVITEELGKEHPERLLYRDLDIVSPYNTYRNKGLPPGPICNPGRTALNAAFNPENTNYLYFLLEDPEKGTHQFSKSLSEHNRSYALYIKGK